MLRGCGDHHFDHGDHHFDHGDRHHPHCHPHDDRPDDPVPMFAMVRLWRGKAGG